MSEKYTDIKEVVKAVLKRFVGVKELSMTEWGSCLYGPEVNRIGCAIGCLFSAEKAIELDAIAFGDIITDAIEKQRAREIVNEVIDLQAVEVRDLFFLQKAHDFAPSVTVFRKTLREFQKTGEWNVNQM